MRGKSFYRCLIGISFLGALTSLPIATTPLVVQADSVSDVEAFWNKYITAINESIKAGSDKTDHLWAVAQPRHIQEMMSDYIAAGQLQSTGGRTYQIVAEDSKTITFTINGSRTVKLKKTAKGYQILSFDFDAKETVSTLDTAAILAGDYSSLAGDWVTPTGKVYHITADGLVNGEQLGYDVAGRRSSATLSDNGQVNVLLVDPVYIIPAGVVASAGSSSNPRFVDASDTSRDRLHFAPHIPNLSDPDAFAYRADTSTRKTTTSSTVTLNQIESFWNSYIGAINDSISAGYDKTVDWWAVAQPAHIRQMMSDYISAGQLQSTGGRTYAIISQNNQTVTFTINGSRTVVLQKQGNSFKIQSFDW